MSKGTMAIWDIAIQAANTRKSGRVFATADVFMASPWSNDKAHLPVGLSEL
jgi:hypothetical protein